MRRRMLTSVWFPFGEVLFGLWLFDWLPAKPPSWLTNGATDDPIIAYPEVARVAYLFLLTMISIGPFIWIDTIRLRRRFAVGDLAAMVRLLLGSKRGVMTVGVLAVLFAQTVWFAFTGVPLDSYFVRTNLVVACAVLMIILLLPIAIVLASSSFVSGELLETAAKQFHPFRVVALLDGKYLAQRIFFGKSDNLRTILGQSWREAVHRLVDVTSLVIVDARSATPPVCEEIRHMLDPRRVGKAIFIVNDDGSAPGLQEAGVDTRSVPLVCCPAQDMPRVIARFKVTGAVRLVADGVNRRDIDAVVRALGDPDEHTYKAAASSLIEIGAPAIEPLARLLGDPRQPPTLRYRVAVALGKMTCDVDPAVLLAALKDADRNVQQGAAWALGNRRIQQGVPQLTNLLNDANSSWYTKAFVVDALGNIGTNEARAALSTYSTRVDGLRAALKRQETGAPEFRLLREYLSRRQVAFGGDPLEPHDMAEMMDFALCQFRDGVRAALDRAPE